MGTSNPHFPRLTDRWAAYQFDNAVVTFGRMVEGACEQMVNVGDEEHPRWERKYQLSELLRPGFVLETDEGADVESMRGMEGVRFDEV